MQLLFSGRLCLRSQGFVEAEGNSGETKSEAEVGDSGRGDASVKWVRSLRFDRTVCPLECLS